MLLGCVNLCKAIKQLCLVKTSIFIHQAIVLVGNSVTFLSDLKISSISCLRNFAGTFGIKRIVQVLVTHFLNPGFSRLLFAGFLIAGSLHLKGDETTEMTLLDKLSFTEEIQTSIYSGWESHYFAEGRDLLDGDSLIINHVQASWRFLRSEIWYAVSPDQLYDELQFMTVVNQTFKRYGLYLGYRHLQFPFDNSKDNEIYAGLSVSDLPAGLQIGVEATHSFVANGFFVELWISRNFVINDALSITGAGTFGINQGYVSDGHDGANHFVLTLQPTYQLSDSISIMIRLAHSWAIERDPGFPGDAQLVNLSNGSIGAQWSF
jgi:hypothetical protein